jgi:hypothetical protein
MRFGQRAGVTVAALVVASGGLLIAYNAFDHVRPRPASQDAAVGELTATIDVEGVPRDVTVGEGLIWVLSDRMSPDEGPGDGTEVGEGHAPYRDPILEAIR